MEDVYVKFNFPKLAHRKFAAAAASLGLTRSVLAQTALYMVTAVLEQDEGNLVEFAVTPNLTILLRKTTRTPEGEQRGG